jgi:hypothetical protein
MKKHFLSAGRCAFAALASALVCVCLSLPARAQASGEYDGVLRQALEEFDRGNWVEARAHFERAHAMHASARTLRAIGLCAFEEKQYVLAVKSLMQALDHREKPLTERQRKEVLQAIARASSFIARYTLELSPEDARVQVDGASASVDSGVLLVDPGKHDLVVSAPGYETAQHTIVAQPNTPGSLRITLQSAKQEPIVEATLAPAVEPQRATQEPATERDESGFTTWQYVGIGSGALGVVGLGLSLYFTLDASATYDESGCAEGGCRDRAAQELNEDALAAGDLATVFGVSGAVALGAGALLFFLTGSDEASAQSARLHVAPFASSAQAGLLIGGQY